MDPESNCSSQCDSRNCFIYPGVNRQDSLDILQRLCSLSTKASGVPGRSLSLVLSAVVWTLLSFGILLAFCLLFFTLRFKNNRIVKMSSPNLNILTLFGSMLTYISGFLFAFDERPQILTGTSTAVMHARLWTLCVGSTLVFGPILGKTWRLYRVFTQRVPDKRVIIRDIQLMGIVALLILMDLLILTAWNLSDPIRCSQSISAVMKVVERDISYLLSHQNSCSSSYWNLWIIIIVVKKGCLLLYGTYLAGLTSNVSFPPVNQSPTIITAVTLVTLSSSVAVPVSIFLQAWPNLVYSTVAGAIFICTLATNCMLFVPQLTEWRQFEDDQNSPSQMAKYFSSPSKSHPSVYSQEEIFYLLGENTSMKKLLSEKNAVIDSLQEQVNNAKDKLLRLMSASQPSENQDVDSNTTNHNSPSTQSTELQSYSPFSSKPQRDSNSRLSPPHFSPLLTTAAVTSSDALPSSEPPPGLDSTSTSVASSHHTVGMDKCDSQRTVYIASPIRKASCQSGTVGDFKQPMSMQPFGSLRTAEEVANFVTSIQSCRESDPFDVEPFTSGLTSPGPNARLTGYVSSEQLQEILQELSVDAVMETALKSFSHTARSPPHPQFIDSSPLSPSFLRTPQSPNPPVVFCYPSISPYAMRKRRPPFRSSRRGLSPPCFYTASNAARCGKTMKSCEMQDQGHHPAGVNTDGTLLQVSNGALDMQEDKKLAEGHEVIQKCERCVSQCPRCSILPCGHSRHGDEGGDKELRHRHITDSSRYWDSDSSSSTDYLFYHRPYCDSCLQRGSFLSSDTSSESSDSECEGFSLYRSPHPVVFKEDLKPTFV